MPGQAFGLSAFNGYNINVRITVVLSGESYHVSVRRKIRISFRSLKRGQPEGLASVKRGDPDIVGIGKDNLGITDIGLPDQPGILGMDKRGN